MERAAVRLHCRPRTIRRQFEDYRRACQPVVPALLLLLQGRIVQPLALPDAVIDELQDGFVKRRVAPGGECVVQRAQLVHQHRNRPTVRSDVVGCQRQQRLAIPHQQQRAQQLARAEIETAQHLRILDAVDLHATCRGRHRIQIAHLQPHVLGWLDRGIGAVGIAREPGAQAFVPADQLGQSAPQGIDIDTAIRAQRDRHVVRRARRAQSFEHPQALLQRRQRHPR